MNTSRRIFSGILASWVGLLLGLAQKLVAVPIFLIWWDARQFGIYLAISAAIGIFSIPGKAYEIVVGRECLKIGCDDPLALSGVFCGSVMTAGAIECIMLCAGLIATWLIGDGHVFQIGLSLSECYLVLFSIFIVRSVNAFPGAVFSSVLACFGYYHKLAWMGLVARILSIVAPIVAVICGANVAWAIIAELLAPVAFAPFAWFWMRLWARKHGIWRWAPDYVRCFRLFILSLQNVFIQGMDMLRQEGLRVVLAPLAGAVALTSFATMRTGANVALQALNTITGPIMPELMKFIKARDQSRMEAAFASVWMVLVAIMAPASILLQASISSIYVLWTHGKVPFDPVLFALLSMSVLVFAAAQPAHAVVQGNNLMRAQLHIAMLVGLIMLGLLFTLVPIFGVRGAGWTLLVVEIIGTSLYRYAASRWLTEQNLKWPKLPASRVNAGVGVTCLILMAQAYWPDYRWWFFAVGLIGQASFAKSYFSHLPSIARDKIKSALAMRHRF